MHSSKHTHTTITRSTEPGDPVLERGEGSGAVEGVGEGRGMRKGEGESVRLDEAVTSTPPHGVIPRPLGYATEYAYLLGRTHQACICAVKF